MGTCCSIQENRSNFALLCKLLIDIGTPVYRNVLNSLHTSDSLQTLVNKPNVKNTFEELKSKGTLNQEQWNKIYPFEVSLDISGFDITLLSFLLKSICSLKRPARGWDNVPSSSDVSTEADLARITSIRNQIHDSTSHIFSDKDFLDYWCEIEHALIRLGGTRFEEDIDKLKNSSIDIKDKEYFIQKLKRWKEEEEKLLNVMEEIGNGTLSPTATIRTEGSSKSVPHVQPVKVISFVDVDAYMNSLKRSVKRYTESLPNYSFNTMVTMATEEIFKIKIIETTTAQEITNQNACFEIEKCSDLFINNRDKNPTRLVIMAGQGVGKSLFCMKLLRDWSVGQLFVDNNGPNLKFAYFLTFRELNLMENLSLTDLLNLSSLLDHDCVVDDALMAYFVQHSDQLLILMDGIDEFAHYCQIGSTFDNRYPDDAHVELPVAVLCAKLLQRKLLPQSVLMVTSRPDEAKDAIRKVHFDRLLEISSSTTKNVSGPFRYQFW